MADQDSGVVLLLTVGGCFLAAGGQPLVNYFSGDKTLKTKLPSVVAIATGAILVLSSIFLSMGSGQSSLAQTLNRWGANPAPYAVILFLFWIYLQSLEVRRNIEMASLRNDGHSIATVLERFILPRRLSDQQSNALIGFLQTFPPQEVALELTQGDDEANMYCADIQRSLVRAGWTIKTVNYVPVPTTQGGLSIHFTQTMQHSQTSSTIKEPKVDLILKNGLWLRRNSGRWRYRQRKLRRYHRRPIGHKDWAEDQIFPSAILRYRK